LSTRARATDGLQRGPSPQPPPTTSGLWGNDPVHSASAHLRLVRIPDLLPHKTVLWVPEGNLAGNFRADFRPIFGQTVPPNPSRSTGLVLQCPLHHKSAPQANILRTFRGTKNFRPDCLQVPRCSCKNVTYCDENCQMRHWAQHRPVCTFHARRLRRRSVREVAQARGLDTGVEDRIKQFLG
jgi:hypothetical protein